MKVVEWKQTDKNTIEDVLSKLGVQAEAEFDGTCLKTLVLSRGGFRVRIKSEYSAVQLATVKEPSEKRWVLTGITAGLKVREIFDGNQEGYNAAYERKAKLAEIQGEGESLSIEEEEIPISKLNQNKEKAA